MATLAEIMAARKVSTASAGQAKPAGKPESTKPGPANRIADIRSALAKAKTGTSRNALPNGSGWFLLKSGIFRETEQKQRKVSQFKFLCVKAISDGDHLPPNSPNYTGPKVGEEYDVSLFQDGGFLDSVVSKNLQALQACMGWDKEYTKQLQASDDGITAILELMKGLLCVDANGVPTNAPCIFANQVVIELLTKPTIKDEKGSDGLPSYDANGNKKQVIYTNTYWQKRIPLADVYASLPEADIIKAFGSADAFATALDTEQQAAAV